MGTALFFVVLLLTLAAHGQTVATLPRIWFGSSTFTHGILILPVCIYLVWSRRRDLSRLEPRPYAPALLLLPVLGFSWFVGNITGTLIVQHFSLVATIPALVLAFFGPPIARALAFPLGFLFFAVPFGDVFQPFLQDLTAAFAVKGLQLTGVPAVREGLYIATPVTVWRVAEACSGLRFLIAGFALGSLFAYLSYRSLKKRLIFMGLSILVPILANGLRAYALILIGYLTDMRLGAGADHYFYGWVVFTAVMVAFFAAGSAFRDRAPAEDATENRASPIRALPVPAGRGRWAGMALAGLVAITIWPALSWHLSRREPRAAGAVVLFPEPRGGWSVEPDRPDAWRPAYSGAASESRRTYSRNGEAVDCYIAFYERQKQGSELIQYRNAVIPPDDPVWRIVAGRRLRLRPARQVLAVRETDVRGPDAHLLVWQWYWLPDEFTADPQWVKLLQAKARLLHNIDHAAVVVLSTSVLEDSNGAARLTRFVEDMLPSIRETLRRTDGSR